jgi:hypothetical protein
VADIWSSTELKRKFLNLIRRPESDEDLLEPDGVTNTVWDLLSEAQDHWMGILASTFPDSQYGAPVLMTTADGGYTYTFGNDLEGQPIFPLGHVEIRLSRTGRVLIPSADFGNGDFVMEGDRIRIPGGRSKTFSSGPYARFVTPPTKISASVEPVLKPRDARSLIVTRAGILWAIRGNLRDPRPWEQLEAVQWGRIANQLATQFHLAGAQAVDDGSEDAWWHNIDTGEGYVRYGS